MTWPRGLPQCTTLRGSVVACPKLLWVEASPNGDHSTSTSCARAFINALIEDYGQIEVSHLDVWSHEMPAFSRDAVMAKLAHLYRQERNADEQAAWDEVLAHIDHVRAHDVLVVSCPMWNLNIPYPLKQWIDVIAQPLVTFEFDRTGHPVGVLGAGRYLQLILTRSGEYQGHSATMVDFQQPYLEYVFGQMLGYSLAESVVIEPTTTYSPDEHAALRERALLTAASAGRRFATTLDGVATAP